MSNIWKNRGVRSTAISGLVLIACALIAPHIWPAFIILGVAWIALAVFAVRKARRA